MPMGRGKYVMLSDKEKEELFEHFLANGSLMKYYAEKYNTNIQKVSEIISDMFEKRKSRKN